MNSTVPRTDRPGSAVREQDLSDDAMAEGERFARSLQRLQ
jgi:hypothetical protein